MLELHPSMWLRTEVLRNLKIRTAKRIARNVPSMWLRTEVLRNAAAVHFTGEPQRPSMWLRTEVLRNAALTEEYMENLQLQCG